MMETSNIAVAAFLLALGVAPHNLAIAMIQSGLAYRPAPISEYDVQNDAIYMKNWVENNQWVKN